MKKIILVFFYGTTGFFILFLLQCTHQYQKPVHIFSPDGDIRVTFQLNKENQPIYEVRYKQNKVIFPSTLDLILKDGSISKELSLYKITQSKYDSSYLFKFEQSYPINYQSNEKIFHLKETVNPFREIHIIFRVFNDGVAFRYYIPNQGNIKKYHIVEENTEFNFPANTTCWYLSSNKFHQYNDVYQQQKINTIPKKQIITLPFTFMTNDNITGSICEAALTNYSGMYLQRNSKANASLESLLVPHPEKKEIAVELNKNVLTPWRVIMLAPKAHKLIESKLLLHLNQANKLKETSWIKPGKCAWDWWSGYTVKRAWFNNGINTGTIKHYIDFASDFGLEYMLIGAGWYGDPENTNADITTSIPEIDMPAVIEYANEKNVGLHLWVHWKNLQTQMDKALPLYKKWGIKGIQIDKMDTDHQKMIDFYHAIAQKSAQHHLLLNLHGACKPTGIRKTYPHILTREAVMGLKYSKWSRKITPEHNLTIPFTRMLAGPTDYSPGGFDNVLPENFKAQSEDPMVMGTRCHHLAMYIIFNSPLQMVADHPSAYFNERGSEFIKVVPVNWDNTLAIDGKIGDYIIMAREHDKHWYIGAMTDTTARLFNVPLTFLDKNNTFSATIFKDNQWSEKHPKALDIQTMEVNSNDTLQINMAPGGGYAAYLSPVEKNNKEEK